jgi:hypothetical protein
MNEGQKTQKRSSETALLNQVKRVHLDTTADYHGK